MESSFLTILPNLSIGVIAIGALVYVSTKFLQHLAETRVSHLEAMKEASVAHASSMKEREDRIREVEQEVRTKVLDQLQQNSVVMSDTVKSHERLITKLDNTNP